MFSCDLGAFLGCGQLIVFVMNLLAITKVVEIVEVFGGKGIPVDFDRILELGQSIFKEDGP